MARVTFKAAGTLAETASSATLPLVAPANNPGDLLIAFYHANDNLVVTLPTGWVNMGQNNNTVNQTVLVAWKIAGIGDSAATFNFVKSSNNTKLSCGYITAWTNPRAGNPFDTSGVVYNNNAVAADNCVFGAYTTTAFARGVWVMFYNLGATAPSPPTGTNVDGGTFPNISDQEAALGATATVYMAQGSLTIPGALGVGTIASTSTVDAISVGAVFALVTDDVTQTAGWTANNNGVSTGPGIRQGPSLGRPLGPGRIKALTDDNS